MSIQFQTNLNRKMLLKNGKKNTENHFKIHGNVKFGGRTLAKPNQCVLEPSKIQTKPM